MLSRPVSVATATSSVAVYVLAGETSAARGTAKTCVGSTKYSVRFAHQWCVVGAGSGNGLQTRTAS